LNLTTRFISGHFLLAFVFFTPIFLAIGRNDFYSKHTKIADVKNYSTDEKRDILNTFDTQEKNDQGFPIDPFDLMNRLQQAESMSNATTPSDALDEAINAFDESEY
tara:strand:- start:201 stop:518 length:318 start_codon:yes stop_codon:yes gene_type:complete